MGYQIGLMIKQTCLPNHYCEMLFQYQILI
nr:MAG TPA: hypothetical protein [Caudoviricetes sp.]